MPDDPNFDVSITTMGKHQQALLKLPVVKTQTQILPNKIQSKYIGVLFSNRSC